MIAVLKHVTYEGPGLLADMMEGRGIPYKVIETPEEGVPFSMAGFSGLVSMGGPMSVLDNIKEIEKEKLLLSEAVQRNVPVLGICLGAQVLASALGAQIYRGSRPEVGWGKVDLTERGMRDTLFTGVDTPLQVLHWHGDTFNLPENAVHLASSSQYQQQAFKIGPSAYGFQFHLEVDGEMVLEWVTRDLETEKGLLSGVDSITGGIKYRLDAVRLTGALVFGRFLDLVAGSMNGYVTGRDS